jgi:hypothetical protein
MPPELVLILAGACTLGGVLAGLVLARVARPGARRRRRRRGTHRAPEADWGDEEYQEE